MARASRSAASAIARRRASSTGVDGPRPRGPGRLQDPVEVQVALGHLGGADLAHLVGQAGIGAVAIGLRAHGDGAEARFAAGAEHARGDLAAVGDQHLVEGHARRYAVRTRAKTAPRSTSCPSRTRSASPVPACSDSTAISVFIAWSVTTGSPAATVAPTFATFATSPGTGATTS